ncbi:MAG: hypothetical protein H6Q36_273 [Chloroflexi bacterium]|nr:hypothetical protein [Chloroflexota bacterium]
MNLDPGRALADHLRMRKWERPELEAGSTGIHAQRALPREHPLLYLQQTAGNAAVSRLVAGVTVQRDGDAEDLTASPESPRAPAPAPEVCPTCGKPM